MKNLSILTLLAILLVSCAPASTTVPVSTATDTPLPTATLTPEPTATFTPPPTATSTPTKTPIPAYDYHNIGFPLNVEHVVKFRKNFNCPTSYGDNSHDGNDIVVSTNDVPVLAVDDGRIEFVNFVNDSIGYEIRLVLGKDSSGKIVATHYVHLSESTVTDGEKVKKGDIIGYITKPLGGGRHLHFEIRIGEKPRYETKSDGAPGDEVDVTEILIKFMSDEKISSGCAWP